MEFLTSFKTTLPLDCNAPSIHVKRKYNEPIKIIFKSNNEIVYSKKTFGDELIRLMDIIIQFLLNHIHTPQNSPVKDQLSKRLEEYTVQGKLQTLISNHIRIN
jgi:hypothetical protein